MDYVSRDRRAEWGNCNSFGRMDIQAHCAEHPRTAILFHRYRRPGSAQEGAFKSIEMNVPKIFDVVKFKMPGTSEAERVSGTVLDISGEVLPLAALVEIPDERGEGPRLVNVPIKDLELAWSSKPSTLNQQTQRAQVAFERGLLLIQNGLTVEAVSHLTEAFKLEPRFAGTLMNLTNDLAARKAHETAIFLYQLILRLQPSYKLALENLCRSYLNRGVARAHESLFAEAIGDFQNALLLNASSEVNRLAHHNIVAGYTQLAIRHADMKQYRESLAFFLAAFQLHPSEVTRRNFALAQISNAVLRHGSTELQDLSASELFSEGTLLGLTKSECFNAYGATLANVGRLAEARLVLERAVAEDPKNELARNNLRIISEGSVVGSQMFSWGLQAVDVRSQN